MDYKLLLQNFENELDLTITTKGRKSYDRIFKRQNATIGLKAHKAKNSLARKYGHLGNNWNF